MNHLPCDRIASDMLDAQRSLQNDAATSWALSLTTVLHMIEDIERLRLSGTDGTDSMDYVLDMREPYDAGEREFYERVLEIILKRRDEFRERIRRNAEHGRYAPFAPLE